VTVAGLECRPVQVRLPELDAAVTVLEATAQAQDALVQIALREEDEAAAMDDDGAWLRTDLTTRQPLQQLLPAVTKGDIYGNVLWPAASCAASYLLRHDLVRGRSILELGAGTGLVSLASCRAGASAVVATDYEDLPLALLRYAAEHLNRPPPGPSVLRTRLLDVTDPKDLLPAADVVVAADILYEPATGRAVARRAVEALRQGSRVVIGDSPGRAGRPAFLQELRDLGVDGSFQDVQGWTVTGERHELICGKGSKSRSSSPRVLEIAILDLDPTAHTFS
jgi:predicted nicotinamide N-methyase